MTDLDGRPESKAGAGKRRVARWLDSDLVGVAATVYTAAVVAISLVVFWIAGPLAGFIVAVAVWIPMVVFAIRGFARPPQPLDVVRAGEGSRHRVLVVANRGLDDPALCREVCRRGEHAVIDAMIIAPVVAASRLDDLGDDVDRELDLARGRVDAALRTLSGAGIQARGRVDVAEPMEALLDGMREFPPNEVVMLPGGEPRWEAAEALAGRVRAEVGVPVTEVGQSASPLGT